MRYFFIFLLVGCVSIPKTYVTNNEICGYNDSIFDFSNKLKKLPNEIQNLKKDTVVVNTETKKNEYWVLGDDYITHKQTNKQIKINKWIRYKKGNIKWFYFTYNKSDVKLYKETYYDKKGNVTNVIDHDKGYTICWSEAIAIVKKVAKRAIKKHHVTGFNLQRTNLNEFPDSKPIWRISLDGNDDYNAKPTIFYWIDGVTGKFVKKTKVYTTYD